MTDHESKVFTPSKVTVEHQKLEDYLNGEKIFPTTVEVDLTQMCNRSCSGCPNRQSRRQGHTLQFSFLDRLFSILGPNTPGIILSGGEPSIFPFFAETVSMARKKGFKQIVVVSNGANIHHPEIQAALLEHVTSIRISMYDWQEDDSESFRNTLKKIEGLRNSIDKEGSKLEIGASILTRQEWNYRYLPVGLQALNAGINWLYFHPYCIDFDTGYPTQADQKGVLEAIEKLKEIVPQNANIQVPVERYSKKPLYFDKFHGAYFLMEVGADGILYAGPECKYDKDAEILNLHSYLKDDFLWHTQTLKRLNETNSDNYRFIGTKHRTPIFSDFIQKVIQLRNDNKTEESLIESSSGLLHDFIL